MGKTLVLGANHLLLAPTAAQDIRGVAVSVYGSIERGDLGGNFSVSVLSFWLLSQNALISDNIWYGDFRLVRRKMPLSLSGVGKSYENKSSFR